MLQLQPQEKNALDTMFRDTFGGEPTDYFSAPGRTEIGGNHTDHQRGRVLAAAVDLDTVAAVRPNGTQWIRVLSQGFPMCRIHLLETDPLPEEKGTTAALVRGVAAAFLRRGFPVGGFDACCRSSVLPGSGLSSSAAFEVLLGTIVNHLFCGCALDAPQVAQIGQWAENVYFGKPCGLMDQMASAVGNLVCIDFADPEKPAVHPVAFDFSASGHALCIIDCGASHAELTEEYASIVDEMGSICAFFGKKLLSQVPEDDFYTALPLLRSQCSHRAILRAIHFYRDNRRVSAQAAALEQGDFPGFLRLVKESGFSSYMYLQNVIPTGAAERQDMALALALCQQLLQDRGAFRVHGGGFAGTVQAFVPMDLLDAFRAGMDAVFGPGACRVLSVRPEGGTRLYV